jgi:hypothetical protein
LIKRRITVSAAARLRWNSTSAYAHRSSTPDLDRREDALDRDLTVEAQDLQQVTGLGSAGQTSMAGDRG